jgi:diacylglycerol kinase (ATP)
MDHANKEFSLKARLQSIKYAVAGIQQFFVLEHNARIHVAATLVVLAAAHFLGVSPVEAILLLVVISLVWITELINTCIEKTADLITTERLPQVKFIKDVAAGAVLVAAGTALITGSIIFIPKIFL